MIEGFKDLREMIRNYKDLKVWEKNQDYKFLGILVIIWLLVLGIWCFITHQDVFSQS